MQILLESASSGNNNRRMGFDTWTMVSVVSLSVLLLRRVPDLQYDLAGLVWCARKHALRLARLRKWQD